MKTVIFGFSRPIKWKPFAKAIMAFDGTNFDHGYMKYELTRWGTDIIYQSSGNRTNFMCGTYFRSINVEVEEYQLEIDEITEAKIGNLCVTREGKPYPVKAMLGIGIVKLLGFARIKIGNPFASTDPDCIAEQGAILAQGLGILVPFDFNLATPREFRNWLAQLPGIKRIK